MKQLFIENILTGIFIIVAGIIVDFKDCFINLNIQKYIPITLICITIIVIVSVLLYGKYNSQKKYDKNLLINATYSVLVWLFRLSPILIIIIGDLAEYTGHYIALTPSLIGYIIGGMLIARFFAYIILNRKNQKKIN